jgi:hypothetical protein
MNKTNRAKNIQFIQEYARTQGITLSMEDASKHLDKIKSNNPHVRVNTSTFYYAVKTYFAN